MRIEKPYRKRHQGLINVAANPDAVFALMCPVREYEWEPGWRTNLIVSESGLVEEGCIFTTPAGASEGSDKTSGEAVWVTPLHDPNSRRLMMIKVTPGETVMRLDIVVGAAKNGASVSATYDFVALSEDGRRIVDQQTGGWFRAMMDRWSSALDGALAGAPAKAL